MRGCTKANGLTPMEVKTVCRAILKSLKKHPENWGELQFNSTLINKKTGVQVRASDGYYLTVETFPDYHIILSVDTILVPWTAHGRIYNHIHRLRHRTINPQVHDFMNRMKIEEQKELPPEITEAFEKVREDA